MDEIQIYITNFIHVSDQLSICIFVLMKRKAFQRKKRFIFFVSYVIIPIEDIKDICQKNVNICQK